MTMPLPEWLTNDADEREELAALGISADVTATPDDQAARDAQASQLLRALGRVEAEIAEREDALEVELRQVRLIYQTQLERLHRRASFLAGAVESLALVSDFGPKKKSRTVGFGTYGTRAKPFSVEIPDEASAVQWLSEHLPSALSTSVTLSVDEVMRLTDAGFGALIPPERTVWKIAKAVLKAHAESTGEHDIPGVTVILPEEKPFAKALPPKDAAR